MTRPPSFDELVGADLTGAERDRLRRVHDLLVSAGPPPELSAKVGSPPAAPLAQVVPLPRRVGRVLAIAAAFAVVVFATGYLAGARGDDPGTFDTKSMTGVGPASDARATLEIFDVDGAGNWPMELRVRGLEPSADGHSYELWLTKEGKLAASCGTFLVEPDGSAVVPLNAPYRLRDFDEWVVVEEGTTAPLLTT